MRMVVSKNAEMFERCFVYVSAKKLVALLQFKLVLPSLFYAFY